jgi:predicted nucleic acid-binding Zn ribbon protein
MDDTFSLDREYLATQDDATKKIIQTWHKTFQTDSAVDASTSHFMLAPEIQTLHSSSTTKIVGKIRDEITQCLLCVAKGKKNLGPIGIPYLNGGGHYVNDLLVATSATSKDTNETFKYVFSNYPLALWLNFERVTEDTLNVLKTCLPHGLDVVHKKADYHYVFSVINNGEQDILERVSKKTRANLRYAKRLAERRLENFNLERIDPQSSEENTHLLQQFFELETAGWKAQSGDPIAFDANKISYYENMTRAALSGKNLSWYRMSSNNKPIAMLLVFRRKEKLWVMKTAYDETYKAYSPGGLVLTQLLDDSLADPLIKTVDMISNYNWLERWNPEKKPYYSLRILPKFGWRRLTSWALNYAHQNWTALKN